MDFSIPSLQAGTPPAPASRPRANTSHKSIKSAAPVDGGSRSTSSATGKPAGSLSISVNTSSITQQPSYPPSSSSSSSNLAYPPSSSLSFHQLSPVLPAESRPKKTTNSPLSLPSTAARPPVPNIPQFLKQSQSLATASPFNFNNQQQFPSELYSSNSNIKNKSNKYNNNHNNQSDSGSGSGGGYNTTGRYNYTKKRNNNTNYPSSNNIDSDSDTNKDDTTSTGPTAATLLPLLFSSSSRKSSPDTRNGSTSNLSHGNTDDISNIRAAFSNSREKDSHELLAPSQEFFRNSLVDNLLLDFDKLGQDFSRDPSFDRFLEPDAYQDGEAEDELEDTYDSNLTTFDRSHLASRQSHRLRSDSSSTARRRLHDGLPSPKTPIDPSEELPEFNFEQNSQLVYTADGRFITTPPQSRRGVPPARVQTQGLGLFDESAPNPTVSNRSRPREPETPKRSKVERRRSTRSNKSFKGAAENMTEQAISTPPMPLEIIPTQESQASVPMAPLTKSSSKPGFFRRVFGGGSASKSANLQNIMTTPQTPEVDRTADAVRKISSVPVQSTNNNENIPPKTPTQLLTKKSSGFFRRRKKSMSEMDAHPIPPLPLTFAPHAVESDIVHSSFVPPSRQQSEPVLPTTNSSRPETAITNQSVARSQSHRHERAPSDSKIIPNVVTSSPNNKYPNSEASKKATIRNIESELSNRSRANKVDFEASVENLSGATTTMSFSDSRDSPKSSRDMYSSRTEPQSSLKRTDSGRIEKRPGDRSRSSPRSQTSQSTGSRKPKKFQGSFLRGEDSDSSVDFSSVMNETPSKTSNEISSMDKDRSNSTGDVFYDAKQDATQLEEDSKMEDRNVSSEYKPINNSQMPKVILPMSDDEEEATKTEDLDITPRPKKVVNVLEEDEDEGEPTAEEKQNACRLYDGDEDFIPKAKAATWLGDADPASSRIRKAYMANFDWTNMNILAAMRGLCDKLVLKAETQQVDRIVSAVAKRWCDCNPNHGFKDIDVIHTILYSLLLLNTDIHLADIPTSQKMSKNQFVRNTLSTIRRGLAIDENEAPGNVTRSQTPYEVDDQDRDRDDGYFTNLLNSNRKAGEAGSTPDVSVRSNRLSFMRGTAAVQRLFEDGNGDFGGYSLVDGGNGGETGGPLIAAPFTGNMRQWDHIVEGILKEFYSSVRATALPLHGVTPERNTETGLTTNNNLSVRELRRTPSTVSKAASETSMRGKERYGSYVGSMGNNSATRLGSKWKSRSRPKLYPGSFASSSRTSFDDRMWSPSASSTWSKYSLDKTATSMMSTDSLGSGFGQGDYMQSIGFANALSTAIIREEVQGTFSDDGEQSIQNTVLDDEVEELALYGAPWAKEGMIKHKHHLESTDKKSKNRGWVECFAVVEKGWMRLFLFPSHDSKKKAAPKQDLVGGGNWMHNAESIGSYPLRQTIASALPPPGYSKTRPHVFALSLPSGAVHFFQVGTAEIVKEWVSTANYWSARLSKEPLVGGVSNMEYGWSNCIDIDAFAAQQQATAATAGHGSRPSFQGSMRSSIDHGIGVKARLPGDKAVISDWNPPAQSMFPSPLNELDQLKALEAYVANVEMELQKHNELRGAMVLAFTPRHPNYTKAMNNWERKSSYLLREFIKFRTYIEALSAAGGARERILKEREERNMETNSKDGTDKHFHVMTKAITPPDTVA